MSSAPSLVQPTPTRSSSSQWGVIVLLVVSVAINYIDRGNLSIAAPLLKTEMSISPQQIGLLLSSFFWTYSTFQLVSGWLVDRFSVTWVMAIGFSLWSVATAVQGVIGSFTTLLFLRLLLGAGESVAYPCYAKILTERLDEKQRGFANSLIDAGSKFGPALGTIVGGLFVARFGWRPFFIALGLGALLWLPFWLKAVPARATAVTHRPQDQPSVGEILRRPEVFATFTGHFAGNYFLYFLLTWLPYYLVEERHFSMQTMAYVGSLPPIFTGTATIIAGAISYRALSRGASVTRVRKTCTTLGLGITTVVLFVPIVQASFLAMAILMLASVGYGIFSSSHWTITHTLAGRRAAGRWSGMQNFFANLAGVVAPALTGWVVQTTGNFFWAFAATAIVVLVGAAGYVFGLGEVKEVQWRTASPTADANAPA